MNRLKKIFAGLLITTAKPSSMISYAWKRIETRAVAGGADAADLRAIGTIITAVVGIAEDAEKAAAKGTPAPTATETAS